jgi:hypothetical protein
VGIVLSLQTRKTYAKYLTYLGKTKDWLGNALSRGYRNNNMGNIRISKTKNYLGRVPLEKNTDGSFEQFIEFRYGTLAMIELLEKYINGGTDTLRKVIYKYAPPSENDSSVYLNNVSKWAGISLDTSLNTDKNTLKGLVIAMGRVENGRTISTADFDEGYRLKTKTA